MQQSMAMLFALLICAVLPPAADAALIRSQNTLFLGVNANVTVVDTPEELAKAREDIHKNWDDMDKVLQDLSVMACKYRNTQDITGAATAMLKSGKVKGKAGFKSAVADIRAMTVLKGEEGCGMLVAHMKPKCKEGCATRWGSAKGTFMGNRDQCNQKCDTVYYNFEKSCKAKAATLSKVYEAKEARTQAVNQCNTQWCSEYPSVWAIADKAGQIAEVESRCNSVCSDAAITDKCTLSWSKKADLALGKIKSDCSETTGLKECVAEKKEADKVQWDKCPTDGKNACESAKATCNVEGKTDATFKSAKEFCASREKMCLEQVTKKCLADKQSDLDKAEVECKEKAGNTFKTCVDDAYKEKKDADMVTCKSETEPKCQKECKGKCKVEEMSTCHEKIAFDKDITTDFCTDFFRMLHSSSAVDPITGDPIVLLKTKDTVAK